MTTPAAMHEKKRRGRANLTGRATAGSMHVASSLRDVFSHASPRAQKFRRDVWQYWKKYGRHDLPWRHTRDPYKILVSEVMLQQTQVPRVIGKYREFLRAFPTARALADAQLAEVLRAWSGLGYNRRAKYLHKAAKVIADEYNGRAPREYAQIRALPGAGEYTAKAVRVFAWNEPEVLIETNIRAAIIHHFFPARHSLGEGGSGTLKIHDREILVYAQMCVDACKEKGSPPAGGPRQWHWALMDYGAYLKREHPNPSRRSAHHAKQSKFKGSLRQVRGAILRARAHDASIIEVRERFPDRFDEAFAALKREGMIS